jgi:hypothetical protein
MVSRVAEYSPTPSARHCGCGTLRTLGRSSATPIQPHEILALLTVWCAVAWEAGILLAERVWRRRLRGMR